MARHDHPLHVVHALGNRADRALLGRHRRGGTKALEHFEQQPLFAVARARQHDHRPRQVLAQRHGRGQLPRVGRGVEFQVAVDAGDLGAERHQPVRVGFGLRPHGRERRVRRPCQPRQPLGRGQRFFVEPRIGQHQRNAALGTGRRHFGPDLGFHQHADARLELVQKTRHGARRVPRLPDLCIARFEQLGAFVAAGGGAMRQQDRNARVLPAQLGDQDGGSACFAERDGMHPALGMASGSFVVVAEALFNRHAIAGLGHRPTPQLAANQRLHNSSKGAVQAQQQRTH
jgi:hypothetical protein